MTFFKKLIALCLTIVLLLPCVIPVQATQEDSSALVRKLINYFHYYQEDAQLDYELILEQMRAQDPALADTWVNILTFWYSLNNDMVFHSDVLPDGLPEDDSLCIVVMGYYLKPDGSVRPELVKRLEVTLASALKYPNAYILCTGGGTSANNGNVTEACQMAKWLIRKGIDSSRVIVEDNALSTIQNAIYGSKLLYENYPQVRNLAVVTSDYHIIRSCLYFHTQAALDAYNAGVDPMRVVANASCRITPNAPAELDRQVEGVGMLTATKDVEQMSQPWLTYLDHIQVTGATEYALGAELNLQVTAVYSNGYSRDVTALCHYTGFDFGQSGFQSITVSYEEGSARQTAVFDVYVVPADNPAPMEKETVPSVTETNPIPAEPIEQEHPPQKQPQKQPDLKLAFILAAVCVLLLLVLIGVKVRQEKKRRRRRKKPMNLN